MFRVTNNNDFDLTDRYDGQDYRFPAGKTVRCPDAVVVHVFGLGNPDKKPVLTRQGWLRSSSEFDSAMEKLNNFTFEFIEEKHDEEFALIEQGKAPLHQAEAVDETEADDSGDSAATAPAPAKRSILKRLEPAQA